MAVIVAFIVFAILFIWYRANRKGIGILKHIEYRFIFVPPKWCREKVLILNGLRWLFFVLSFLSIGRLVPHILRQERSEDCGYKFVDAYVTLWLVFFVVISLPPFSDCIRNHASVSLVIVTYRLFEIFQSWVSMYVLGGVPTPWQPRNVHRSLVLVFMDYFGVTVSYAVIVWVSGHFDRVTDWQKAISYSIQNATTIGTSPVTPIGFLGYFIFVTQVMFALLFLTSVVNRIIARD